MPTASQSRLRDLIKRFSPLFHIDCKYHGQLAAGLQLIELEAGDTILRKSRDPQQMHYLVSGTVEVRASFDNRYPVAASETICGSSLESIAPQGASVKTLERCTLLIANAAQVDQLLSWGQDYQIYYLDGHDLSIDGHVYTIDEPAGIPYTREEKVWENRFTRSKLAANLPTRAIHQLFDRLEAVPVTRGQLIIKANTPGDYFYIIMEGEARVQTDSNGPFQGQTVTLQPGDYFGDEALVARTIRNASVTMNSDGLLGRLPLQAFNRLIREHLISPFDGAIDQATDSISVIDVRLPLEYRLGHDRSSINIPISFLRQQMSQMKQSALYVMSPANDCRAELATYLMRQAGFDAYCMQGG